MKKELKCQGQDLVTSAHAHLNDRPKDRVQGWVFLSFSGLPSRVDSTPLVDSPKIFIEIFSHSSVLKIRAHVGHKF